MIEKDEDFIRMKNRVRRERQKQDELVIEKMLLELKKKHEKEHQEKIAKTKATLKMLTEGV